MDLRVAQAGDSSRGCVGDAREETWEPLRYLLSFAGAVGYYLRGAYPHNLTPASRREAFARNRPSEVSQ